jgi:hypothetical protein
MDSFISVKLSSVEAYRAESGLTQWQSGHICGTAGTLHGACPACVTVIRTSARKRTTPRVTKWTAQHSDSYRSVVGPSTKAAEYRPSAPLWSELRFENCNTREDLRISSKLRPSKSTTSDRATGVNAPQIQRWWELVTHFIIMHGIMASLRPEETEGTYVNFMRKLAVYKAQGTLPYYANLSWHQRRSTKWKGNESVSLNATIWSIPKSIKGACSNAVSGTSGHAACPRDADSCLPNCKSSYIKVP